jgi:hypothetical protein
VNSFDSNISKFIHFINHYILTFEKFLDSKQKHLDSYLVSPVEITFFFPKQNISQFVQVSLLSQIFHLRLAVSSAIGTKPDEFQVLHQGRVLSDQEQLFYSVIIQNP